MGERASEAPGAVAGRVMAAATGTSARPRVCSNAGSTTVGAASSSSPPGDHYEGQFEGQNGAGEGLSELVPARVS